MKYDRERVLQHAHFWLSGLIGFGLGHLILSRVRWGIVAAVTLVALGALGKTVVHSMLEKHYRNSKAEDL